MNVFNLSLERLPLLSQSVTTSVNNLFVVGKPNDVDAQFGRFVMDEFYYWNTSRARVAVNDFYQSYAFSKPLYFL